MGMYDSVYVDESMAHMFPDRYGNLPLPDDEWQTKDLDCFMTTVYLKHGRTYGRFKDQYKLWPLTATFEMYKSCLSAVDGKHEFDSYYVSVDAGVIQKVSKAALDGNSFPYNSYPFKEEAAQEMEEGIGRSLAFFKKLESERTFFNKVSLKLRRFQRKLYNAIGAIRDVFK